MNEHIKNLQQLINIAIQKGVFSDSNSVIALQNSLNEIIKELQKSVKPLEGEIGQQFRD